MFSQRSNNEPDSPAKYFHAGSRPLPRHHVQVQSLVLCVEHSAKVRDMFPMHQIMLLSKKCCKAAFWIFVTCCEDTNSAFIYCLLHTCAILLSKGYSWDCTWVLYKRPWSLFTCLFMQQVLFENLHVSPLLGIRKWTIMFSSHPILRPFHGDCIWIRKMEN